MDSQNDRKPASCKYFFNNCSNLSLNCSARTSVRETTLRVYGNYYYTTNIWKEVKPVVVDITKENDKGSHLYTTLRVYGKR